MKTKKVTPSVYPKRKQEHVDRLASFFKAMMKNSKITLDFLTTRDTHIFVSLMLDTKTVKALATEYNLSHSAIRLIRDRAFQKSLVLIDKYDVFYNKYKQVLHRNAELATEIEELRFFIEQMKAGDSSLVEPRSRMQLFDKPLEEKDFGPRVWHYFIRPNNILTLEKLLDYKLDTIAKTRNVGIGSVLELIEYATNCNCSFRDQENFLKKHS